MSEMSFTQLVVLRADGVEDRWGCSTKKRTRKQAERWLSEDNPIAQWTGLEAPTLVVPRDDGDLHYTVELNGALRIYDWTPYSQAVWGHYAPGAWTSVRNCVPMTKPLTGVEPLPE